MESGSETVTAVIPIEVKYDSITGVPNEYNEFLPQDSDEYKLWKATQEGPEAVKKLQNQEDSSEKILPGGKVQKKKKLEVIIEVSTRSRKKSITSVHGLETFNIKLSEASKIFGKKFASGASIIKSASGTEHIDIQGDVSYELPDFLVTKFKSKGIEKKHVYQIYNKKKEPVYDSEVDSDED